MYYHVVPKLKLILAWSPKCACTTAKSALLEALGHEIVGNVHNDMLTPANLKSGQYGIFDLHSYHASGYGEVSSFYKVCIIRDPYSRYISAIRQRAHSLIKDNRFRSMNAGGYLDYLAANDFGKDHHFHPQTKYLRSFELNRVLDISEMHVFFEILGLEYDGSKRFGYHTTKYGEKCPMLDASLLRLTDCSVFPRSIHSWLDEDHVAKLKKLYANDFEFAVAHGFSYEPFSE